MRTPILALCAAIALAAGTALAATAAKSYGVDELVAKHIEARGGADKLKAIKSVRIEGLTVNAGQGFELATVLLARRPDDRGSGGRPPTGRARPEVHDVVTTRRAHQATAGGDKCAPRDYIA